jgi:hypothetical protein
MKSIAYEEYLRPPPTTITLGAIVMYVICYKSYRRLKKNTRWGYKGMVELGREEREVKRFRGIGGVGI